MPRNHRTGTLCLTRRVGEQIVLSTSDGEVTITVLSGYQRLRVRLGVQAPPGVTVFREELREFFADGRPRRNGKAGASSGGPQAAQEDAAAPPAAAAAVPRPEEDDDEDEDVRERGGQS